jgi:hypothetical protein
MLGFAIDWRQAGPRNPAGQACAPATIPNSYKNPNFTFTDKVTKIWSAHSFKAGIYIERVHLEHISNVNYRGSFDFSRNTNNPFDSGHSFANALLGNFSSYRSSSARAGAAG